MLGLKKRYNEEIKSNLQKELDIKNIMCVPALEKIVISVGAGEAIKDSKLIQNMADTISLIAGQRAVVTKAKKSWSRGHSNNYGLIENKIFSIMQRHKSIESWCFLFSGGWGGG